jgi:hypothetical protein
VGIVGKRVGTVGLAAITVVVAQLSVGLVARAAEPANPAGGSPRSQEAWPAPPVRLVDPYEPPPVAAPEEGPPPSFAVPARAPRVDGVPIGRADLSLPDGDARRAAGEDRYVNLPDAAPAADREVGTTTERHRTIARASGGLRARIAAGPARRRDPGSPRWDELDGTLVVRPDGRVAPRVPLGDVSIASDASAGDLVRVTTPAGVFTVEHPAARPVPGQRYGMAMRFDDALGEGSTLIERPLLLGVEETVVVESRRFGPGYDVVVRMPPGVRARQGAAGVEFVGESSVPVAAFDGGFAFDSRTTAEGPAGTEVSIVLARVAGDRAEIRVEVPGAWFDDPGRVFPVFVDPDLRGEVTTRDSGGGDTYVSSAFPTQGYWTDRSFGSGRTTAARR